MRWHPVVSFIVGVFLFGIVVSIMFLHMCVGEEIESWHDDVYLPAEFKSEEELPQEYSDLRQIRISLDKYRRNENLLETIIIAERFLEGFNIKYFGTKKEDLKESVWVAYSFLPDPRTEYGRFVGRKVEFVDRKIRISREWIANDSLFAIFGISLLIVGEFLFLIFLKKQFMQKLAKT